MRQLLVNADDFGISEGVSRGILYCYQKGIVRSASLMANFPSFETAVLLARQNPGLKIGVHLNATSGVPLLSPKTIPSLVSSQGMFYALHPLISRMVLGKLEMPELEQEWAAQIERVLGAGLQPTHLDTHQHVHGFPVIRKLVTHLAKRFSIPRTRQMTNLLRRGLYLRSQMLWDRHTYSGCLKTLLLSMLSPFGSHEKRKRHLLGVGYVPQGQYQSALLHYFKHLPESDSELVCHPGFVDAELSRWDQWTHMREEELKVLSSSQTWDALQHYGVHLDDTSSSFHS